MTLKNLQIKTYHHLQTSPKQHDKYAIAVLKSNEIIEQVSSRIPEFLILLEECWHSQVQDHKQVLVTNKYW